MNKTQFIAAVAEKSELTKKDADKAVNAMIEVITDTLKAGNKVQIMGFGNFEVKERAERAGINPATKQPITIAASKTPVFKAGKALKDSIK